MKKIDQKELGLLVKSQEYKSCNSEWLNEALNCLIQQRVIHCKSQLDYAMSKDEAFYCNHSNSDIIIYVNKDGNNYGHFGIPTYNHMVDYLNDGLPYDKGIIQQALRQHLENLHSDNAYRYAVCSVLSEYQKDEKYLEGALTELLLIL